MRIAILLLSFVGCTEPTRPVAVYDPASDDLFDAPWPSDTRRDDDGTISVAGYPNPDASAFVGEYIALAETMTGFGTNSPIYIRFRGPIDTSRLPDAMGSLEDASSLGLFAIAPGEPWDGERVPLRWHFTQDSTSFEDDNLLAIAPEWGFPLRGETTYGLVVTTDIARRPESFTLDDRLIDALPRQGYGPEDVAIATTFTTLDPTEELARIVTFLRERVEVPVIDQELRLGPTSPFHDTYQGRLPGPLFQHGARPYAFEGGGFQFREDGQPIIAAWESLRFAITIPRGMDAPADGWPVVLYQHGTSGDAFSFASGGDRLAVGAVLARAGFVGIGIDQPLHGERQGPGTDQGLHTFNYLNPDSARATIRQGAIDAIWLAEVLAAAPATFVTPRGDTVRTDPSRLYFMGHSQGGLTGAVAAPWLGDHMDAVVLSGAGAGLSITIMERKDPFDIASAVESLLGLGEGEHIHELHPVVGLVQMLVEVTDPINYAPLWFDRPGPWGPEGTANVLHFSGLEDEQTPARAGEALAVAGRLMPLAPSYPLSPGFALLGYDEASVLEGNAAGWDGPVTAAFSQWEGEDHFVVFDVEEASDMYARFLVTAREGSAVAER